MIRSVLKMLVAAVVIVAVAVAIILAFDLYLHRKFDNLGALNYRGYRGSVVGAKAPDELRVGVFGGSVAMGYGVPPSQSIAAHLERILASNGRPGMRVSVVNLAANNENSQENFAPTYRHFRYLGIDTVVLFFSEERFFSFNRGDGADWSAFARSVAAQKSPDANVLWNAFVPQVRNRVSSGGMLNADEEEAVVTALNTVGARQLLVDAETTRRELGADADLMPEDPATMSPARRAFVNRILLERRYPELNSWEHRFEQLPFTLRTGNWVFRTLNYWYIFPNVMYEKYLQRRYGDIDEGYRRDRLFAWLADTNMTLRGATAPPLKGHADRRERLADVVAQIVDERRTFVFVFPPTQQADFWLPAERYAQALQRRHRGIEIAVLTMAFPGSDWASYFLDTLHYTDKGNRRIAEGIAASLTKTNSLFRNAH